MDIKVINNEKEWEDFYYYKTKNRIKFPKKYPCFAKMETEGGGLGGEFQSHYVTYPPTDGYYKVIDSFLMGLNAKWEYIC